MIITAYNPETDDLEKSYLSNSVSAGATSLAVKNNDRFAINDRLMVGELGREKTETLTVGAVSGGTGITVGATVFSHSADDPVYKLRFDQVKFYRSTTGVAGTYSIISTQALDVDNDTLTTTYDDTSGLATYYYKVSYYNSISTLESSLSDPVLGSGYSRGAVGFMIDEILKEVADPQEEFTSRSEILGWFNEVNDFLSSNARKPYAFLHTRQVYGRTAGAKTLAFPTDMLKFDRLDYVFTDTAGNANTYPVRVKSLSEFRNSYGDSSLGDANDELQFIALDDTVDSFRLWPRSKTTLPGVFYIYYWKIPTTLDSEGDLFETDTPRLYKLYAMARFYRKKSVQDFSLSNVAQSFERDYTQEVFNLNRRRSKDAGSPNGFKYNPQDFKNNRRF